MVEGKASIVNSIQAEFVAHVFDHHATASIHVVVANAHDEAVDALVLTFDNCLGKDDSVVGVASTVSDPELLGKSRWRVYGEFLGLRVVDGGSLHLGRIVAVSKLGEAEAAHVLQGVDLTHEWQMALGVQGHKCATEEVELHSELSDKRTVNHSEHFVRSENVLRIFLKIEDRDNARIADLLDLCVGDVTLLVKRRVKALSEDRVLK